MVHQRKKDGSKFVVAKAPRVKERTGEELETDVAEKGFAAKLVGDKLTDARIQTSVTKLTPTKWPFVEVEIVSVITMEVLFLKDSVWKREDGNRFQRQLIKWETQFIVLVGGGAIRTDERICVERRFGEIERETNEIFELDDFDVGSLLARHFQAIGQFDNVLGNSFSNEKEIGPGKKFY